MDELTFLLILAGIGVVLLVAMFTYYKHHKKIHDEIKDFNHHTHEIDDVLLKEHKSSSQDSEQKAFSFSSNELSDDDLPGSFTASKQDGFDIEQVNLNNDSSEKKENVNDRELVDGVYINSKRVISNPDQTKPDLSASTKTTDTFSSYMQSHGSNNEEKISTSQTEVKQDTSEQDLDAEKNEIEHKAVEASNVSIDTKKNQQNIKVAYDPVPEGVNELIISHTILSKDGYFNGSELFNAIQSAGLEYGEMNIFHFPGDEKQNTFALFSIANVVEPGIFNLDEADTFSTPGISMFMRLPARIDNYIAYEKFIDVAQKITTKLDGELCDETRSQLTQQAITYKKEQIRKLNFEITKAAKLAGMN